MSTRATYAIGDTVFYCHYDGYPTGAAERFENMVEALTVPEHEHQTLRVTKDAKGGPAYAFIRGNFDAEPAWNNLHTGHGDTDWRYTLATDAQGNMGIQVERRIMGSGGSDTDRWVLDFSGELVEWFTSLGRSRVVSSTNDGRRIYATKSVARELARTYASLAERFGEGSQNRASALNEAHAWEEVGR